mmetsp:Transcript_9540/g.28463  ORF Transcript_9540/g.28463 Transcript_9540/m.28463 type:complete len:541 (-) Transcript_9540:255-1877(-)|eukprot:CAMPEP_0172368772 /NCGR_PEP_ID=MMETSP1060-20121228/29322_1 /TAXON_ID=37318 /ORGANISM="Pseudo-nitzschia pungens, Strain cf. cingulata" /LENGTH=540 /DNA_ID=CAMNT_0013093489 /DNA_START=102 /DNA_END=1724 /DNA_ORIENTATION=-
MINQTDVVTKFASLIGTKRASKELPIASSLLKADSKATNSRELLMCISKSVPSDKVVCTLPSLDMRKLDEDPDTNPLPNVGEHFPMKMEASVLHNAADASAKAAQGEPKAAQTLGSTTTWTRSSVVYASKAISENAANSFSSLVESRVRAWTLLLLRHSLTTGDTTSRTRLLSMLASIIKVHSAEIAFKPQALPANLASMTKKENDPDVILPLLFEVDLRISVQNNDCTVTLRAPGTISADFDRIANNKMGMGLTRIDVQLNTGTLLESMVKEARMVVFNAVAKATSANSSQPTGSDLAKSSDHHRMNASSQLSSGFSSALKLSTSSPKGSKSELPLSTPTEGKHQPAHRALKAQSSLLRLGSVLSTSSSTIQKTRSVQFSNSELKPKANVIQTPKRQKLATTARLTSFKSFGRPHAGDFGSEGAPNNATFGDFGGSQKFWGRDGKLASKPKPMLPSETTDMMTSQTRRNANATFDVQKPPIHLSRGSDLRMGLSRKKEPQIKTMNPHIDQTFHQVPTVIPRTATALEGWYLEKKLGGKR